MNYFYRQIYNSIILILAVIMSISCSGSSELTDNWNQVDRILERINPPKFSGQVFNITFYGAVGNGTTDCTKAFELAINECANNGGGRVLVPQGVYLTGAIHLKSNINLHLADNAVIRFSKDKNKYLPVVFSRWEGVECMNYSALIYAYEQENIAITGNGLLDGQGSNDNWWNWRGKEECGWKKGLPDQKNGRDKLFKMAEDNIPPQKRIMGEGYYLRPNFVHFYKSKNILIEGVTFKDSPMWFLNPVLCQNISVIGVKIEGLGPNNDGCDPESCKDILIKNCFFNTGDDCIAIKSGRNNDGRRINISCENIIIQNCKMQEGHGGVVIGSEISGGVKNVFAENCSMSSPNLERAIRIKTNSVRGGKVENIFTRDIEIGEVKLAVLTINFLYEEGDAGNFTPSVSNVVLENITSKKSSYALWIKAYERSPIIGLRIENCRFENVENGNVIENVNNPVINSVKINGKDFSSL